MLETILSSKTKLRILRLLISYPNKEFSVTEVIENLRIGKGRIKGALSDLASFRIIMQRKEGKEKRYKINSASRFYGALNKIFSEEKAYYKTLGVEKIQLCSEIITSLKDKADMALVFGSHAKGTYWNGSDIDLFVVSDSKEQIRNEITILEERFKAKFETLILPRKDFEKTKTFREIKKEFILLFDKTGALNGF